MAAQFLVFLETWIETFPEYRDDDVPLPFYAGEVNGSFILRGSHMPVSIFLILLLKLSNIMPYTEMYVLGKCASDSSTSN